MSIRITAYGVKEAVASYRRKEAKVKPSMIGAMQRATAVVRGRAQGYPASKGYPRTGTLGRSITDEVSSFGGSVRGIVKAGAGYAPGVKGEGSQWWMHVGFWPTLQGDLDASMSEISGLFVAVKLAIMGA